jgi:hypothetical protein
MMAARRLPFLKLGESIEMLESNPSFYFVIARFIGPVWSLRSEMPSDLQAEIVTRAKIGLEMFLSSEFTPLLLPRSTQKANVFLAQVNAWLLVLSGRTHTAPVLGATVDSLNKFLDSFGTSLQDELDRLPMFTATTKGNLDIHRLIHEASLGYPSGVLELIDDFIKREIDAAGRCLAFELPTSSGFHILRAVEIGAKAYVHAATGSLPPIKNRNWGEYILQLTNAGAGSDLIDVLKVLKTKRNPLMHPQDVLELADAISLFCICQAGIEELVQDIRKRSLDIKFKESLSVLAKI